MRFAELRDQLERAVRRICPRWLTDRREDLVQVALVKIMELGQRSEEQREYSPAYLWRVAHSALIDEIRRLRRRREETLEEAAGGGAIETQPGPERLAVGREIGRELWECLGRLIRPRRLAVTLHLQGYPAAQAAPLLGFDTKRVYNLVHRGLADLRECLAAKGLDP